MIDPTKIRPNRSMVLLQVLPKKTKLDSGVVLLPETNEDKVGYVWAKVIRLGSGKVLDNGVRVRAPVEPGEIVLVRRYLTEVTQLPQNWGLPDHYGFVHQDDLIAVRDGDLDLVVTRL